jgi:hypothetical protein
MAEQIDYTEYNRVMKDLASKFEAALKQSLAKPYPFAPGYNGKRSTFGVRNMTQQTGNLYNSISVTYDEGDNQIVVTMLDYWKYVNDGRHPHPSMNKPRKGKKGGTSQFITALKKWSAIKFGLGEREALGVAFAVRRNINQFGIKPTYFYDEAFQIFEKEFEDEAVQALGIDAANFFEAVIEQELKS